MRWSASCVLGMVLGVALLGYGSAFGGFIYGDFSSVEGLDLFDAAFQDGNVLRLTPSEIGVHGSAVYSSKLPVEDGFNTSFTFRICDLVGSGADRIDFGVGETAQVFAPGGITVEIDTYQNSGDPNGNHIEIGRNGGPSLGIATLPFNASDGNVHRVDIQYDGTLQRMMVTVDDAVSPIINIPLDLSSEIALDNGKAWAILYGETGRGAWEAHDIHSWSFESEEPEPTEPSVFLSDVGDVGGGVDPSVVPELNLPPGSNGSLWVWVTDEQPVDTTFALDIVSDTPGVIDFTGAEVLNADVTVDGLVVDTRWQGTSNGSVQPDGQSIDNFVGVSVTEGTGLAPNDNGVGGGLLDAGYDVAAGAFLFARVDFDVIGEGVTNLSFGEGRTLIVHAGVDVADQFDLGTSKSVVSFILGDVNRDGGVDGRDVGPFIQELVISSSDPFADMDGNGAVNGLDVAPFVDAVVGGGAQAVPEPSTFLLCIALGVIGALRKWGV